MKLDLQLLRGIANGAVKIVMKVLLIVTFTIKAVPDSIGHFL